MSDFSKNLKNAMFREGMNQKNLADATGMSISSISQYLSGKTGVPKESTLFKLANVLNTSVEYLTGQTSDPDVDLEGKPAKKMTVSEAAKLLGKSEQFIRVSLQVGRCPFGFAVQMESGKWCYHISPKKFFEYVG